MTLIDDLLRRIGYLKDIGFQEAPPRYGAFLDWLESQPLTSEVLARLRQEADIDAIFKGCGPNTPPQAATPEDVARVGLYFFEYCKEDGKNLPGMFRVLGLHSKWGGSQIDGYFASAIDKYIQPFVNYLIDAVRGREQALHADDVAAFRINMILSDDFAVRFPRTSLQLTKISKELHALDHSGNWFNAANSCRELLKRYTTELYAVFDEDIPDEVKAGDVKTLLRHIVSRKYPSGRTRDSLLNLIQSVWDHTQCLLHREDTDREEANRIYLWVALLISEIYQIDKTL